MSTQPFMQAMPYRGVLGKVLDDWKQYGRLPYIDRAPKKPKPVEPIIMPYVESAKGLRAAQKIVRDTCDKYGVDKTLVMGKCNTKLIVAARHEAMYLVRQLGWSYPRMSRFFLKHHTTIIVAMRVHEKRQSKMKSAYVSNP